jgi:crossover junction endodeoxyribonuclease RusA
VTRATFTTRGRPRPQGSKSPRGRPGGPVRLVESSPHLASWRENVSWEAVAARGHRPLFTGPVAVRLTAYFVRPDTHYTAGGELVPDAPHYPTTRQIGDIDKLARAVLDGITGTLIEDDRQVAQLLANKAWGDTERCVVTVIDLDGEDLSEAS